VSQDLSQDTTVPKSRVRSKAVYTPPPSRAKSKVSAPWLAPTMVGCLLVGLAWIALYYVTGGDLPVSALGAWNLAIGFVLIISGVGLSTKWR
jgi:Cell division protein CrgA